MAPQPTFALHASSMIEIGRYARDARVTAALLDALVAAAETARDGGVDAHLDVLAAAAGAVGGQAVADARTDVDRDRLTAALARFTTVSGRASGRGAQPDLGGRAGPGRRDRAAMRGGGSCR